MADEPTEVPDLSDDDDLSGDHLSTSGGAGVSEDESPYEWLGGDWLPDTWEHREPMTPTRDVDRFRRTTAGSIIAAGMLGLQQVLEGRKKEDPPIEVEAPGEPPGGRRLELDLDPDDPAGSRVTYRPWA